MIRLEWPTLLVLAVCYAVWGLGTTVLAGFSPLIAIAVTGAAVALHASLQHEAIHGHPTRSPLVNGALVFPALTLVIPYLRFHDTHIAHHTDARLTDPFDDPETNFVDRGDWMRFGALLKAVLEFNNTLLGRLLIGPIVAQVWFMRADWGAIRDGDRRVLLGWVLHLPALALVLAWIGWAAMPLWHYLIAAYIGNAIIKIRTFAEHQAHELAEARTVIIEDRGPLAFLFLNNNLHAVHHAMPGMAWYDLPGHFARYREAYLTGNNGYRFRDYGDLFRAYFLHRKDPVPHPLWQRH